MIKVYQKQGQTFYEVFVVARDGFGKQFGKRKRGLKTEKEAQAVEFKIKKELEKIKDTGGCWTWARWHDECVRRIRLTHKRATVIQYDSRLKHQLPKEWVAKEIRHITPDDVYELTYRGFDGELTDTSRRILFMLVRRILEMAVIEGIIPRNPANGIRVARGKRTQKVLTAQEAQTFLNEAQASQHRFYPIWVVALKTGMRSGEMYALTWPDIDFDAGTIQINKQWTSKDGICPPKNEEWRTIPIGQDFREFLIEYRLANPGFTATLFDSTQKKDVTRSDYVLPRLREWHSGMQAEVTREFCETVQVTSVKFHDLRATFITNLLSSGVPLVKVMAMVGHRKMATTDVYLRLAGIELKGATDEMGYTLRKEAHRGKVIGFEPKKN